MTDPVELALHVDRFMRRIHAGLHARAAEIDEARIGPFGGMILMTLAEQEPMPLHRLVADLARDKSQMTRLVKTLEAKGMVVRAACPADGRVSLLSLTPAGRAFVEEISQILADVLGDLLAPLPPKDRDRLAALLRRL